jgi:hypothetical protein
LNVKRNNAHGWSSFSGSPHSSNAYHGFKVLVLAREWSFSVPWREHCSEIATGIERFRRSTVLGRGSARPGPEPSEKCAVNKVPIGRYIAFVGSLLLAILFIADWYLPMAPTQSATSREAEPIIRIKSDRKWPERIVFDTSAPTIVPQKPTGGISSSSRPRSALLEGDRAEVCSGYCNNDSAPLHSVKVTCPLGQWP